MELGGYIAVGSKMDSPWNILDGLFNYFGMGYTDTFSYTLINGYTLYAATDHQGYSLIIYRGNVYSVDGWIHKEILSVLDIWELRYPLPIPTAYAIAIQRL